jgi:phosphoribosylaminoimidazole carboxylase PurE protein
VTVAIAAGGYPAERDTGSPIAGVDDAEALGAIVFHAGTAMRDGQLVTSGGRILNVTGLGDTIDAARTRAYEACERISFSDARYRSDIAAEHETQTSPVGLLEELDEPGPLVGILVGSESDLEAMDPALAELRERGISHELRVLSAHRDPRGVAEYASTAQLRGVRVIIAGAGMAAALPGVVAAYSDLPVIGVPLRSSKSVADGLDALLAIAQMPPGVPVACVSVDGSRNAAILAARILAQGGGYPQAPSLESS